MSETTKLTIFIGYGPQPQALITSEKHLNKILQYYYDLAKQLSYYLYFFLFALLLQKNDYQIVSWRYNKIPVQINYINSWTLVSK